MNFPGLDPGPPGLRNCEEHVSAVSKLPTLRYSATAAPTDPDTFLLTNSQSFPGSSGLRMSCLYRKPPLQGHCHCLHEPQAGSPRPGGSTGLHSKHHTWITLLNPHYNHINWALPVFVLILHMVKLRHWEIRQEVPITPPGTHSFLPFPKLFPWTLHQSEPLQVCKQHWSRGRVCLSACHCSD